MKKYFPLILILILGTILRFYHNTLVSLWHDEAFSVLMIRYPWHEMFYRLGLDVHPPGYYILLRFWVYIFGGGLLALRSLSVLFGVGTIWAGFLLTKEAFKNEKAALWAALFIAINPFQLKYVIEARMYTMGAFFALLAGYFLVKALHYYTISYDSEKLNMPNLPNSVKLKKLMWWSYVGFTLSMIVIIYTHYYLFFTAAALGFYGLLYLFFHHSTSAKATGDRQGGWKKYLPMLSSLAVIAISFLPWLKTFLFQLGQVDQNYWIPPMDRWSIPATFWDMLLSFARDTTKGTTQIILLVITLFSFYFLYRFVKKTESFHKWLVVFAVAAPFAGALLFALLSKLKGSNSSVFLDRYFLFASVYFSIALAVWLKEISLKWLSVSLFLIYVALNFSAYINFWQRADVYNRPGMAGVAKFLQANVEPQNKIYINPSSIFFNYEYYNKTPVKPLFYTKGIAHVKDVPHYYGTALLTDADLVPDLKTVTRPGDTVWIIWTNGFYSSKPEVPLNWTQVDEREFPEVQPTPNISNYVTEYKVN